MVYQTQHKLNGNKKIEVQIAEKVFNKENPINIKLKTKKIFIGGLPINVTEEELKKHFKKFGEIEYIKVTNKWKIKEFAFLKFKNLDSSKKCIDEYKNHFIRGKWIEVRPCIKKDNIKKIDNKNSEDSFSEFKNSRIKTFSNIDIKLIDEISTIEEIRLSDIL